MEILMAAQTDGDVLSAAKSKSFDPDGDIGVPRICRSANTATMQNSTRSPRG
jgi:hypothetical protein